MKKMTCEQAYNYVIAGYFPSKTDIESIVDLQDIFGHLPYHFNCALLNNDETTNNALTLFERIWCKEEVESMMRSVNSLHANRITKEILEGQIREAEMRIAALQNQIKTNSYELAKVDREIGHRSRLLNVEEWLANGTYSESEEN